MELLNYLFIVLCVLKSKFFGHSTLSYLIVLKFYRKKIHHVGYVPSFCFSNHRLPSCLYCLHLSREEKCYDSSGDGCLRWKTWQLSGHSGLYICTVYICLQGLKLFITRFWRFFILIFVIGIRKYASIPASTTWQTWTSSFILVWNWVLHQYWECRPHEASKTFIW